MSQKYFFWQFQDQKVFKNLLSFFFKKRAYLFGIYQAVDPTNNQNKWRILEQLFQTEAKCIRESKAFLQLSEVFF